MSTSGDTMSTLEGYHEYIGGCSVHPEDIMMHVGDIMSTSGDVQYTGVFNINWKAFVTLFPHMHHDIPPMYWTSPDVLTISTRCTHGILQMYSWYPPDVLMISPQCTYDISPMYVWYPPMYWTPPDVFMIRCTHGIPPMYPWYPPPPPDVPIVSPSMYWTHIIQGGTVSQPTGWQIASESLHWLLKMIIQAVQALTDLCKHILNTCTVLNCATVLKFDMLQ